MTAFRKAAIAVVLTPVLAAAFLALLAAALAIPDDTIARNIAEDAELFEHPRIHSFTGRKIDVGTECIGVSYGLGDAADAPAFAAAARSPVIFDCPSLLGHVGRGVAVGSGTAAGEPAGAGDYAHYWHGYAAILRPLLALFPYHDVRMLTFNAMAALFAFLGVGLYRAAGARFAFAALLPFYFVNYSGFFELWTKAAAWIVMLAAANIIVRTQWTAGKRPHLLFYFAGAACAYVDLSSTPLLVFGYPAALYFLLARRDEPASARAETARLVTIGAFWTLGYAGLWLAKIAIAAMVLGPDVWASAARTAAFRLNGDYESVKHFLGAATLENFEAFKGLWGGLAVLTFFVAPFVRKGGAARFASLVKGTPALALIALSPFVWYEIMSNHSQIHGLFTHANLVLTFLPFSLVLARADLPASASPRVSD